MGTGRADTATVRAMRRTFRGEGMFRDQGECNPECPHNLECPRGTPQRRALRIVSDSGSSGPDVALVVRRRLAGSARRPAGRRASGRGGEMRACRSVPCGTRSNEAEAPPGLEEQPAVQTQTRQSGCTVPAGVDDAQAEDGGRKGTAVDGARGRGHPGPWPPSSDACPVEPGGQDGVAAAPARTTRACPHV